MKNLKIGDKVTVTVPREAYYSSYAGNPKCIFEPGEVGVIGAVKVPKVQSSPGGDYCCCIDFTKLGKKWRTSANYGVIKKVK